MKKFLQSKFSLVAFMVLFTCLCFAQSSIANYYGEITDPSGDAAQSDLIFASITVDADDFTFKVQFAPGTFYSNFTGLTFALDTDQDPSTGRPGSDSGEVNDAGILGTDYHAVYYGTLGEVRIYKYVGAYPFWDKLASSSSYTLFSDGVEFSFSKSYFGSEEGLMNFKVVSDYDFSSVQDYMPDIGSIGTTSAVPLPAAVWLLGPGLIGLAGLRRRLGK